MAFKSSLINFWQRLKSGRVNAGGLLLLLALLALSACDAPGDIECVEADEWGKTENRVIKVDPTREFNSAGISVYMNEPLLVEVSGNVNLCPETASLSATSGQHRITPAQYGWQDSGLDVTKGEFITITVDGSYVDSGGTKTDGEGLYAYIAPAGMTASDPANSEWWYGVSPPAQGHFELPGNNRLAMDDATTCHPNPNQADAANTPCNPFFELWNNGTAGAGGGYSGLMPKDGRLYFRYARTANSRGVSNHGHGDDKHTPWKGYHRWEAGRCNACRQTVIMTACYGAGLFYPICVAGWQIGCSESGHLERAVSDSRYRSSKCQEWYDSGSEYRTGGYWGNDGHDHFVNERASDENYNDGTGYTINVGHGCPGKLGKYMDMVIATSTATLVPAMDPPGCTAGTTGCTQKVDDFSQAPLMEAQFTVKPINTINMNSSITLPPGFVSAGVYKVDHAPTGGELWFKIKDTARERSVSHPQGAYYPDNTGHYSVHIVTTKVDSTFSNILNGLVDPIRKLIFGYCQIVDNPNTANIDESRLANSTSEEDCLPKASTTTNSSGDKITKPGAWRTGITEKIYNNLVGSGVFRDSVRAGLLLMMVIYGIFFMMGMIKDLQEDAVKRVLKIAIIIILIGPDSWEFFNKYLFSIFINGMNSLIGMLAGDFMGVVSQVNEPINSVLNKDVAVGVANVTNPFAFIDGTITKFMNGASLAKVLGLIFASPLGFLYALLIISGMVLYLFAVLKAAILYILAMISISLLLIVGPIFISFIMFERTKSYFDNWIKSLINYLFQPVLVFTALSIFNVFVYSALYMLLHYKVCWDPVISLDFGALGDLDLFNFYLPRSGVDGPLLLASGMPMGFFLILIFIIVTNAMLEFVDFMAELAAHLTVGARATALSKAAASTTSSGLNIMKGVGSTAFKGGVAIKDKIKEKIKEKMSGDGGDKKTPRK